MSGKHGPRGAGGGGRGSTDLAATGETLMVAAVPSKVLCVTSEERFEAFLASLSAEGQAGIEMIVNTNLSTRLNAVPFIKEADVGIANLRKLSGFCSYLAVQE